MADRSIYFGLNVDSFPKGYNLLQTMSCKAKASTVMATTKPCILPYVKMLNSEGFCNCKLSFNYILKTPRN